MHVSLDSALGRQRRLNSVGESVLQIAPNAAAAYSLRSLTGGDPKVVRVRRGSNNVESDFTASGVSSGALLDFVTTPQIGWNLQPTFSNDSGTGSVTSQSSTATTATVSFTGDATLLRESSKPNHVLGSSGDQVIFNISVSGLDSAMTFRLRTASSNTTVASQSVSNGDNQDITLNLNGSAGYLAITAVASSGGTITFNSIKVLPKSGFVETWYDQSGNSKDAIQTTANLQPVIVAAGVFQNGLKFDSDGSSSGPDFRTPISSAQLSNDPAGNAGFALVWVGNVNQVQHADTQNHSVLGNIKGVATFSTGTIGLTVIPKTGTTKFISETGGSTTEIVEDTNALTPGDFGVVFFSYEDAGSGVDPLLSVDGSTTTSGLSSLSSSSSNNIGIMTAITGGNAVQYSRSTDGICKEVLLYTGDQKSKRVALETNIAAEYGITLS